ncbi:MAG: hypothetical protein ACK5MT_00010 [Actinomycetales bacterium]
MCERVAGDLRSADDLAGLVDIGVDEISVRHEALLFRMEVKDVHRLAVVAVG